MPGPPPRRYPQSLSVQSGLVTLQRLLEAAGRLESDYTKVWQPSLTRANLDREEGTDVSGMDCREVVDRYQAREEESQEREVRACKRRRRAGSKTVAEKRKRRKVLARGVPPGVSDKDYIEYRKCLYVATVQSWRESLQSLVSPPVLDLLVQLLASLYKGTRDCSEPGLLTLQAVLMSSATSSFISMSEVLVRGAGHNRPSFLGPTEDHRIGPTILRSALADSSHLTRLSLEKVATDPLLDLVSQTAPRLQYLNITHSLVTDRGLLDLCGAHLSSPTRPALTRKCKRTQESVLLGRVSNIPAKWTRVQGKGCPDLACLKVGGLSKLSWHLDSVYQYTDYQVVPMDCGFVACLALLPKLKVLHTEVGGRAVLAFIKNRKKNKLPVTPLRLEVLVEAHPTPSLLTSVAKVCPHLVEVRVDWHQFYTPHNSSREDWLMDLNRLPKLSSVFTSDIDFKTDNLDTMLPAIGPQLTKISLQELWSCKYSLIRNIKRSCPGLERLCFMMTCKEVVGSIAHITVEKDVDMALENSTGKPVVLKHLTELHLFGPFEVELVRYLVAGCDSISSLSLGIEWPNPTICNVAPAYRKDYLGVAFLQELLDCNSLSAVRELHLMSQYARGRKYLNKDCAMFVLKQLPNLKHLGTFRFWNLLGEERREVVKQVREANRDLTFDEDFSARPSENVGCLRTIWTEGKSEAACSWLPVKPVSSFTFLDEVADIFAEPALFWPPNQDDYSDEEENEYDDDEVDDLIDDGELEDEENEVEFQAALDAVNNPGGFEPLCCIQ